MKNDEDFSPHMASEDADQGNRSIRNRSRRSVKAQKYKDVSETEEEEDDVLKTSRVRKRSPLPSKTSDSGKAHPQKRQRWVPHNPLIVHPKEDDSSRDIQISDDEESGGDVASCSRRQTAPVVVLPSKAGGSVPLRDESGRFAGTRPPTEQERRQSAVSGGRTGGSGGGIFKNAAVQVLREERKLMSTGDIARIAMKRGYVKVQGRTPEATMASAMYTDVKRKSHKSLFIRPHEGLFGLREWILQGIEYHDPVEAQPSRLLVSQGPSSSQPNSRSSRRVTRKSRSVDDNPLQEEFTSQVTSGRQDGIPESDNGGISSGTVHAHGKTLRSRLRTGNDVEEMDHTPFDGHGDGPPPHSFFHPQDGTPLPRSGLSNIRKRSTSGSLPALPSLRGPSNGRRQQSHSMSPQNSDNMLRLLNAVDFERSSGLIPKVTQAQEHKHSGVFQPQPQENASFLTYNSGTLPNATAAMLTRQGPEEGAGTSNTSLSLAPPNSLSQTSGRLSEEALRQLEASFGSHPLQIANSLLGPIPPAIRPPDAPLNEAGLGLKLKEGDSSNFSEHSSALVPGHRRLPGSAFQAAAPPQMPRSNNMPAFGPPEESVHRIPEVEAHIHAMENSLGMRHPKVGKGYLYLSRVYQLKATPEFYSKAQDALTHAYEICYAGQVIPNSTGL